MSVARQHGDEGYDEQAALQRELREIVADQLHDLVLEREELGGPKEVQDRIGQVVEQRRRVTEARGRQLQAREHGIGVRPHVQAERDARSALRAAVLSLGECCGSWVVALDFEERRPQVDSAL